MIAFMSPAGRVDALVSFQMAVPGIVFTTLTAIVEFQTHVDTQVAFQSPLIRKALIAMCAFK